MRLVMLKQFWWLRLRQYPGHITLAVMKGFQQIEFGSPRLRPPECGRPAGSVLGGSRVTGSRLKCMVTVYRTASNTTCLLLTTEEFPSVAL